MKVTNNSHNHNILMIINNLTRKGSTLPESRNKRNKDVPDSKAFAKVENLEFHVQVRGGLFETRYL